MVTGDVGLNALSRSAGPTNPGAHRSEGGCDRELPPDRMEQDQDDLTGVSPIENLNMEIISLDAEEMVFDMSGVDASIANALRRILLSEVKELIDLHINLALTFNAFDPTQGPDGSRRKCIYIRQ